MTKFRELDDRGISKVRKTIALMRLPKTSQFINELADCQVELSRAGAKSVPVDYFADNEVAPIISEMKNSPSFWHNQIGIGGELIVASKMMHEIVLRRMRLKAVHGKSFLANTP